MVVLGVIQLGSMLAGLLFAGNRVAEPRLDKARLVAGDREYGWHRIFCLADRASD